MFKDKELRKSLQKLGLVDDEGWSSGYKADKIEWLVENRNNLETCVEGRFKSNERIAELERKVEALMELLAVTQEGPTTDTVLKKGSKKVVVKKQLL